MGTTSAHGLWISCAILSVRQYYKSDEKYEDKQSIYNTKSNKSDDK